MNVRFITDEDLASGRFTLEGGPAIPIEIVDDPEGGLATPVYLVTVQRKRVRGKPLRVTQVVRSYEGRIAIPVYQL